MDTNQQLSFLQEKIEDIGSAIFYNLSEAVLKFPTSVVSSAKVDDYGFIWFCVQKPKQNLNEFEQEFPVKMDFYKKGKGYFLQLSGKGFVVTDPEEMNAYCNPSSVQAEKTNEQTLVKVKIQKADCYETPSFSKVSWWQSAWTAFNTWFRHDAYRTNNNTYYPAS